jgi:hypothetical protein
MDWFDDFKSTNNTPIPWDLLLPNSELLRVIMKYTQLRDIKFLSHHVNIVDNNKVSTVINTKENTHTIRDAWNSTNVENKITTNK